MSELIRIVEGGYQRVNSDNNEIIPANQLIPFREWEDVDSEISKEINGHTEEYPETSEIHKRRIKSKAEEYSRKMKAPFYMLEFEEKLIPKVSFRTSFKKATLYTEGKIKLYVNNK